MQRQLDLESSLEYEDVEVFYAASVQFLKWRLERGPASLSSSRERNSAGDRAPKLRTRCLSIHRILPIAKPAKADFLTRLKNNLLQFKKMVNVFHARSKASEARSFSLKYSESDSSCSSARRLDSRVYDPKVLHSNAPISGRGDDA
ncbi:hypothetical protein EVAR_3303_1 [Eumeta japonica]|uniref:Uncharacterized protein n=1 Tax=Eumeta variegata TaxID=151549 RepID=A0A4C1SXT6_EUMVA|nr:hypothetical protein EVAR_3303_1 [Eumeta japonica]